MNVIPQSGIHPYILLDIIVRPTVRFKKKTIAYIATHASCSTSLVFNFCDL